MASVYTVCFLPLFCWRGSPGREKKRGRLGPWTFSPLSTKCQLNVLKMIIANVLPVVGRGITPELVTF